MASFKLILAKNSSFFAVLTIILFACSVRYAPYVTANEQECSKVIRKCNAADVLRKPSEIARSVRICCPGSLCLDVSIFSCESNIRITCKKKKKFLPDCPEVDGMELIIVPNPVDCEMYYVCNHGKLRPRHCNNSLHFNPKLKVCDYPYRAGCVASSLTNVTCAIS